jgi:tripartite-type tricarboxylate transporter receptor subunit TctC
MHFIRALVAAASCILAATAAFAQTYPTKPIHIVVPFPPGGADITLRLLAAKMQEDLGQPIVVDNRAGANGAIGSESVTRSAPDGYTLLYTPSAAIVANMYLIKDLPYSWKDFTPVSMVFDAPNLLLAHPSLPVSSLSELMDHARRNPGKLTYASSGIGGAAHMEMEVLKFASGVDILHVPYKGFGPAVQDLLAGGVNLLPIVYFASKGFITAGKAKVLAVADSKRYPPFPQIPALTEVAPSFQRAPAWLGVLGPAGMARGIVNRLRESIVKGVNAPDVRARFEDDGLIIYANTPEQFADALKSDVEYVGKVVKMIGIKPE